MDDGFPFTTVLMVLDGAGVLHRPFLRNFWGVGIFSVARHVYAQQLWLWLCSLQLARTAVLHAKEALVLRDSIHCIAYWAYVRTFTQLMSLPCAPISWDVKGNAHGIKSRRYTETHVAVTYVPRSWPRSEIIESQKEIQERPFLCLFCEFCQQYQVFRRAWAQTDDEFILAIPIRQICPFSGHGFSPSIARIRTPSPDSESQAAALLQLFPRHEGGIGSLRANLRAMERHSTIKLLKAFWAQWVIPIFDDTLETWKAYVTREDALADDSTEEDAFTYAPTDAATWGYGKMPSPSHREYALRRIGDMMSKLERQGYARKKDRSKKKKRPSCRLKNIPLIIGSVAPSSTTATSAASATLSLASWVDSLDSMD